MIGINSYMSSDTNTIIECSNSIDHDYNYFFSSSRAIFSSYTVGGSAPSILDASIFIFNNKFEGC